MLNADKSRRTDKNICDRITKANECKTNVYAKKLTDLIKCTV